MKDILIRVPATSANLGCGFDSVGFAVNLFLELEILHESKEWKIIHDMGEDIPNDEKNLIIATALKIAPKLQPHTIRIASSIPLERGLGSSSSALVAGIELACVLSGKKMSIGNKLKIACESEGHPDNVTPAILGGLVVSSYVDGKLEYVKLPSPNASLIAYVPGNKMSTVEMRKVLPAKLAFKEAVAASAISNVMIAALAAGDIKTAGRMMQMDRFHENYRASLVPHLDKVREISHKHGAYAVYLSGAGSTVMCIVPKNSANAILSELGMKSGARPQELKFENHGARTIKLKRNITLKKDN